MDRLKLLIVLMCLATLVTFTVTDSAGLDITEKVQTGIKEFKYFVDGLEKVVSDKMFLDNIKKLSGFLGVAGGLISIALIFVPKEESPELKFMKREFAQNWTQLQVNMKLDRITDELDNIKDLITQETQRASYLDSSSKILFAYKELTNNYLNEITNVSCLTEDDCLKERLDISEQYVKYFNIKADIHKILIGTIESVSVFGDPLLNLIGKPCDVNKILDFSNGVVKLAFKGQYVVLAYEKLTGSNVSIASAMLEWSEMVYKVRQKADEIALNCYNSIGKYIKTDVENSKYQTDFDDDKKAAEALKGQLNRKYPWVQWTIQSYYAYGGEDHWGGSWFLNMPREGRKRVLRVFPMDNGTYSVQRQKFESFINKTTQKIYGPYIDDAHKMFDELNSQLHKTGKIKYVKNFIVVKGDIATQIVSDRSDVYFDKVMEFTWKWKKENEKHTMKIRIFAVFWSDEQMAGVGCTKSCSGKGSCHMLPYTSESYCICKEYYDGENCENYDNVQLAANIDTMLSVTSRIPKLTDVYFKLDYLRDYIGVSLGKSTTAVDLFMQTKFDELHEKLTMEFKWEKLLTVYSNGINKLTFYLQEFQTKMTKDPVDLNASQKLAKLIARPNAIEQWLYDLNKIIVGREDIALLAEKPLILMLIYIHRAEACSSKYKEALDTAWRQLIVLQNQAYVMWAKSLAILNESSSDITSMFQDKVSRQTEIMQNLTCEINVLNSINTNCTGGFYMYPGIELQNQCDDNFYLYGNRTVKCGDSSSCYPCNCNVDGSSSTECDDQTGQCSCKPNTYGTQCHPCNCYVGGSTSTECDVHTGQCSCKTNFYGTRCQNRDCVWSNWTSFSSCGEPCSGDSGTKKRTRTKISTKFGEGKECIGKLVDAASCNAYICVDPIVG